MKVRSWRDSNDYRAHYFRKSPGLLGFIWFCSQCGKPLLGKKNVEVDHVLPPSKFAKKKYDRHGNLIKNDSLLARAMNTEINTVAICAKCNKKKSNKIGFVTTKGVVAKVIETVLFSVQRWITIVVGYALKVLFYAISLLWSFLLRPLKGNHKWYVKLGFIGFYVLLVLYIVQTFI